MRAVAMLHCSIATGWGSQADNIREVRTALAVRGTSSPERKPWMLTHLRDLLERWRTYRRILGELSTYDHRDLMELDIRPGDVNRIAWEAAFGPAPEFS